MNQAIKYLFFFVAVVSMYSCIKDETLYPCPLLSIDIEVEDKNYSNVDKVWGLEERRDENLPFREYIPTLYCRLSRLDAGKTAEVVWERKLGGVEGDDKVLNFTFPEEYPFGTYVLTSWGGLEDLSPLDEQRTSIRLHRNGTEGRDLYFSQDTITFGYTFKGYTVGMKRIKGKLIVESKNLPSNVTRTFESAQGVAGRMNTKMEYDAATTVKGWKKIDTHESFVANTLLAPSLKERGTAFALKYCDTESDDTILAPTKVGITMERNRLSVLRYEYQGNNEFAIYVLIDDNWEIVHGMDIE